jgi:hypothetical protein
MCHLKACNTWQGGSVASQQIAGYRGNGTPGPPALQGLRPSCWVGHMTDTYTVYANTPKPHTAGLTAPELGDREAYAGSVAAPAAVCAIAHHISNEGIQQHMNACLSPVTGRLFSRPTVKQSSQLFDQTVVAQPLLAQGRYEAHPISSDGQGLGCQHGIAPV